jgi:hypothetical protein
MEFKPGIFFGMSEEDYFSVQALSASGIKWLRQSPLDYWARQPWLNPNYEPEEESFARTLGKAYHKRILEGAEAFATNYAPKLEADEHMLVTIDHLKAELEKRGLPKTGKTKQELIDKLLEHAPSCGSMIWAVKEALYLQDHAGKVFLPQGVIDRIELAAAMIEKSPTLGQAFRGGYPEVSIFWMDEETGCPCKCRVDYLKPKAIVDLKTISEEHGREFARAVDRDFANYRYAFQATHYIQGVDAALDLMKEGQIFGGVPLTFTEAMINADPEQRRSLYVFQQKGPAPIACGKVFNRQGAMFQICAAHLETARRTHVEYMAKFGADPWVTDYPITEFQDDEVPPWATE